MFQRFLKCVSVTLVLVLLFNMMPVQAFADLLADVPAAEEAKDATAIGESGSIVAEIADNRDTYTKQFLLDNGNKMTVQYAIPVHYQNSDGTWLQYDNRMTLSDAVAAEAATDSAEPEYRVIQSDKDVRLSKKTSEKKQVTIEKDGHQISWGFSNINKVDVAFVEDQTTYEGNEAYLTLEGIIQEARYDGAFSNVDLQYFILPTGVKENIILKTADAQNVFEMEYKFHQLTATQTDPQNITLSDKDGNAVYTITAPTMCDAGGVWSNALTLTIVEAKNNKLTVKLTIDQQWLQAEDRQFPVTVDPTFETEQTWGSVDSTTIVYGYPNRAYGPNSGNYIGSLYVGYEPNSYFAKTRSLVRLNTLPELSPGDVIVNAQLYLLQQASNKQIQIDVHQATADWEMATATWNSMSANYNPTVEDYTVTTFGSSAVYNYWDVTDLVRQWYDGTAENYGMMLIAPSETSSSMSRVIYYASTYPNNVTVRPVFQITYRNHNGLESYWDYTASSAGRAGTGYVNSHTGNLVWTRTDMGFGGNRGAVTVEHIYNSNDAQENLFGVGYGWRTNFNQRVYAWEEDSDFYIWEDADGTDHYFEKESTGIYKDEDGLELTLTNTGSGDETFIIEDKYGNKTYFDASGRLSKISNNQQTPTHITVSYASADSLQISSVTDGVGRVYAFTYNDGVLTRLSFKGTGTTELFYTTYAYANGLLTAITDKDGETVSYAYNADYKYLTAVQDIDDYKIAYEYTHFADGKPSRISKVQEFDGTVAGGVLTIAYGHNETTLTDKMGNTQVLQFNTWGNTVSIQDGEGRAQFAQYAQDTDSSGKGNQLQLASKLQNTVRNLFKDNSFEDGTTWTNGSSAATVSSQYAYIGSKSLYAESQGQTILGGGSYAVPAGESITFSGWVKVISGYADLGFAVNDDFVYSETLSGETDWTRLQVSYTNESAQEVTLEPVFGATCEAYLDGVQLEYSPTASRFNLVNNGDFLYDSAWTATNVVTGDGRTAVTTAAPKLDATAYAVVGTYKRKSVSQTINISGEAGDSFVLGGWAMGDAIPLWPDPDRTFGLYAIFHYTDGEDSAQMPVSFSTDASGWQYAAVALVAEKDYSSVEVGTSYNYGANTVYFDGIQFYRETFGTSYTYNADGTVESVVDLQNKMTEYQYDDNGNLTQIMQDGTAKMTYGYDDYHNVTSATTEEGLSYAFTYDGWGNNTTVTIVNNGVSITSTAVYTEDGHFLSYVKDALGNETHYGYNTETGVLDWVQYPEDTAATRTNYTYDDMYRTATAALTTDTGLAMSAQYTYTDDYLTAITTPTTTYNFTYGNFGLRSSVKVGTQNLASYVYDDFNRLERLDYGNGDKVEYTYDEQSRLICETYEDGDTVTYSYDNSGNLATVTDSATGITTTYYYDLIDRLVKYEEKGTDFSHSVSYIYDADNNLQTLTEVINGVTTVYTYTYDDDNRVTSVSVANGTTVISTVTYTYDAFGRTSQQVTKHGDTTVLTENATFNAGLAENSTSAQIATYNGFTYTYDANGNITSVTYGGQTTTYEYDSANQLVRENNQALGKTWVFTYDNAGNILDWKEYNYTTGSTDGLNTTNISTYEYGDDNWGDLLTVDDGATITHDEIGNPLVDETRTFTWEHGRQLASLTEGDTWHFTYNANGLRTKRTNGTTTYTYVYNGSQLTQMTKNAEVLTFAYDAFGVPLTVTWNGTVYYYSTNLQGDIVAILDSTGAAVVAYTYDAWGILYAISGSLRTTLGALNPLCYRGYVRDSENGLYYLQSRYYDPWLRRFFNADAFAATGQGLLGNNMFAYCENNPIMLYDPMGYAPCMVTVCTLDPRIGGRPVYDSEEDAAFAAGVYTRIGTNSTDVEYACGIYRLNIGGYIVGDRFEGQHASVGIEVISNEARTMQYTTWCATVHSHPFCNGHIPNSFSQYDSNNEPHGDLLVALIYEKPIYLAAPNGTLYKLTPNIFSKYPSLSGGYIIDYSYEITTIRGGLPMDTTRVNCIGGNV